jgi:hypothetical protein
MPSDACHEIPAGPSRPALTSTVVLRVTGRESWVYALGLALLYTSAYYLPYADAPHQYWLPYPSRQILYPSLIGTLLLIPLAWLIQTRYAKFGLRHPIALLGMVVFGLDFVVSALSTVGYSAADLIASTWTDSAQNLVGSRWVVVAIVILTCVAIVAIAGLIKNRLALVRLLSTLGYLYAIVALVRMAPSLIHDYASPHPPPRPVFHSSVGTASPNRPREVVWIIFDELDYGQTLGSNQPGRKALLPHFLDLSRRGVSGSNAYSPARDTIVSLPSLLMGQFPAGYKIDRSGLSLHLRTGGSEPFDQAHTVFAQLPGGPTSGAFLGYYHPYCALLPDVNPCVAIPMENVGRWFDALLPGSERLAAALRRLPGSAALPGEIYHTLHPMYRITQQTLQDYPSFLRLDGHSLVFLHVNLPHYPAEYAQRVLHVRDVASLRNGYIGNLPLVDELVGTAVQTLAEMSKTRDILLIISSDHWHRIDSPSAPQTIPWIAWHVGETAGPALTQEISTEHTSELALDFLHNRIGSQQEIPAWWLKKSFFPPLMPDHYKD